MEKKAAQADGTLRTVDLFSGCGGMSLGFQNAGFDVAAAFDNWDPAIEVYRRNFLHPIHKKNRVCKITGWKLLDLWLTRNRVDCRFQPEI